MAFADGTVYAMTNQLTSDGGNQIIVYHRANDGTLTKIQTIATTGGGSGIQLGGDDALGSQGGLMLSQDHSRLFAVNTESAGVNAPPTLTTDCNEGSISSFTVAKNGTLTFIQKTMSGGLYPNSLAIQGNLLYVLNAGGGINTSCTNYTGPNITGFTLQGARPTPLPNSTQSIDGGSGTFGFLNCDNSTAPFNQAFLQCGLNPPAFPRSAGQIGFAPGGKQIVVTDKGPNKIYVFPVLRDGTTGMPAIHKATGPNQPTYFGFGFDSKNHLIVSEPFGATPAIPAVPYSAVSSFSMNKDGSLTAISSSVPNGQGTSCWVKVAGQYAYVSNNASGTISSYTVGSDGSLTVLDSLAAAGFGGPNDIAVAVDGHSSFLYALAATDGNVEVFRINGDGSLKYLQAISGLPVNMGAQGLAVY